MQIILKIHSVAGYEEIAIFVLIVKTTSMEGATLNIEFLNK